MSLESTSDHSIVETALQSDLDVLFAAVGHALSQQSLGVARRDRLALTESGKAWIKAQMTAFRALICSDDYVRNLVLKPSPEVAENTTIVCSLADVIVGACGGIPAVYVATLLLKIGLRELCKGESSDDIRTQDNMDKL